MADVPVFWQREQGSSSKNFPKIVRRNCISSTGTCLELGWTWIALIPPQLPDSFQDWYLNKAGKRISKADPLYKHLHREIFHQQWQAILDDDFVEAYQYGIKVKCFDSVERQFFPRIMTYAADYPEKYVFYRYPFCPLTLNSQGFGCWGEEHWRIALSPMCCAHTEYRSARVAKRPSHPTPWATLKLCLKDAGESKACPEIHIPTGLRG